jgi:hypothetical protein
LGLFDPASNPRTSSSSVSIFQSSSPDGHDSGPSRRLWFSPEAVMKIALTIIPFAAAALTTACVPMYGGPAMRGMPPAYLSHPPAYGPSIPVAGAPAAVGRWDNVMMLPYGAAIEVLSADGQRTSASFVAATTAFVRVQSVAGEAEIPAEAVVRIDRWLGGPEGTRSVTRDAARGAAVEAGAIGVIGLLVGRMPPARTFAAGAIVGGYDNAQAGRALRQAVIIYLAPSKAQRQ